MTGFTDLVLHHWDNLSVSQTSIDGRSLTIADVVMVARHLVPTRLVPEAAETISRGNIVVQDKLAKGDVIYGTNTGFGGSANTRTIAHRGLQQSLFSHLMFGVLANDQPSIPCKCDGFTAARSSASSNHVTMNGSTAFCNCAFETVLPINEPVGGTTMPEAWARAAMLVRLNSLSRGASGIRLCVAESLVDFLNKDIVPRIPLRGSISASGDLSPLSYIGAAMQGKQSATVFAGPRVNGKRIVVRADAALANAGIAPIDIQAKEGLAIVNGTAVSAGIASLALHECFCLTALSQVLTAMSVEALLGAEDSFDPFIAQTRPHPGQLDSAQNIYAFLRNSRLTLAINNPLKSNAGELCQDRYSIRTASQWIGPVTEDFVLAYQQLCTEINSVTDNPLVDVAGNRILSGGNFQARAVTSAVEKLRQGLQSLGRMLFTQSTELINPATNRGLPPNLASDDPSSSYLFKGIDVMAAALTSELGFLANPVGTHVQTAEMGNQALNSLALISTRYTLESVEVFSQLAAAHIVIVCQALDLRALECEFRKALAPQFAESLRGLHTTEYLGQASKRLYRFVRHDLGVPFLGEELLRGNDNVPEAGLYFAMGEHGTQAGLAPSLGTYLTAVYEAIRSGRLYEVVIGCLKDTKKSDGWMNGDASDQ
ncbi:L-Aspartase-like protein [Xylaria arbuscula]|nr:L-Aspartase-like protein [Xylaria arbuscula]